MTALSSLWLVKAGGGSYMEEWDHTVCWFPEETLARAEATWMTLAGLSWRKKLMALEERHDYAIPKAEKLKLLREAQAAIRDPEWDYRDLVRYFYVEVPCGMLPVEGLERLATNIMAKAKENE